MQHWSSIRTGRVPRALMTEALDFGLRIGNDNFSTLLLHMDGADASTTFTDSSSATHTVTPAGNAQIDVDQSKFGGSSGLFDGTGDYLTLDGSADFAFGTGDFTVDFWVRIAATGVQYNLFDCRPAGMSGGAYPVIFKSTANVLLYRQGGSNVITGTTALTTGQWYHVALARSGTSTKLFLDGTQEGSAYTDSTTYLNGASRPAIGANGDTLGNGLNGWLDEVRVSKGVARWTANFTPPLSAYI